MNDNHDNAETDKGMLEKLQAKEREVCDPRKRVVSTICSACWGSGLDRKLTTFCTDEENPEGYWEEVPCDVCKGSGLSQNVQDSIENGVVAERDLKQARELAQDALDGLYTVQEAVGNVPRAAEKPEDVEEQLGLIHDQLADLLEKLDPAPPKEH